MSGPVTVPFSEIEAWSRISKTPIPGYEAVLLHQLSRDYCAQFHKSKNPNELHPLMPDETREEAVASAFVLMCKQLKAKEAAK